MPVYDYKCNTCGKTFEYKQRIVEDSLKKCPVEICEQDEKGLGDVERVISKNIGLVFNGKGFYITDYVHKNNSNSTTTKKSSETKSD